MAEYCRECATKIFGVAEAYKHYRSACLPGETEVILCEVCGDWVELDHNGWKVSKTAAISREDIKRFDHDASRSAKAVRLTVPRRGLLKFGLWLLAVAFLTVTLQALLGGSDRKMSPAMSRVQQEKLISEQLVDPSSARFSGQFHGRREGAWCGYVNAKNRLGGYTGDQRFVALRSVGFIETAMPISEFEDIWATSCR